MRRTHASPTAIAALLSVLPLRAQQPAEAEQAASLADLQAFTTWIGEYRSGAIRMMKDLQIDEQALAEARARIDTLARWNSLPAAVRLFEAATVDPLPPGARTSVEAIDFQAELQPWKIRAFARRAIAGIAADGIDDWLLAMLDDPRLRASGAEGEAARARADAAMQILGLRNGTRAQLGLLEATGKMPDALRLRAVDVLSQTGNLELVERFLDMLRDRDDDVRIAALNALGQALAPHTDETEHATIPTEVAGLRDRAVQGMQEILERDKVWQVRAAACENLAKLRTRHAVPALIEGYAAELKRKKDPWAMDMRMHRTLEGLTGQSILPGDVRPWQQFWKAEGASFRLAKAGQAAARNAAGKGRYERFFSIDLESDRVLFVVDFSGSMQEPITLTGEGTAARPGVATTKARLVVEELKKIVLAMPDGSYFNVVVFSDDVRVWRPTRDGYPELVRMNDETRDDLLGSFLDSLAPQGPTNLHGALDTAIGFAGRGLADRHYALGFDTVYVLSDGAPSFGRVTDKDEIRRLVRESNRLKRLTIHCVTFGAQNDTDFLRLLAEENGGRHIHVD
jgi:hypothetical protein